MSRKLENLSAAPASIFVITPEDIRRMGATSLPEALRIVPGLHVARIDANKWAISSRGFSSHFSNKLLVMIDGRTVYTPLFSGVYWDAQDLIMEDIARIEVIRGPGAESLDPNAESPEGSSPQNQVGLQSYLDLPKGFQFDTLLHHVDELPAQGTPSYARLDVRFGWHATDRFEIALLGQNLFDEKHLEFDAAGVPFVSSFVQRSIFLQLRWRH